MHGFMCACVDPPPPTHIETDFLQNWVRRAGRVYYLWVHSPPDVIVFVISGERSSFLLYHARGLKLRLITLRQ